MAELQKKKRLGWHGRLAAINEIIAKLRALDRMEINISDTNAEPRVDKGEDNMTIVLPNHNARFRALERRVSILEDTP